MGNLLGNVNFMAALIGLASAQLIKFLINLAAHRECGLRTLISNGGMPSSHTSTVISLTVSVILTEGFKSPLFAICFVMSIVIMNDSMTVRYETGKQAETLNNWSMLLSKIHGGEFSPTDFKTMVGHSGLQVFAGALLGLITGFLTVSIMGGVG